MALAARANTMYRQQAASRAARRACPQMSGRMLTLRVDAALKNSRTAELRRLLRGPNILTGPCCHDGLSARLIEQAGFPYAFMSGFCTAGAKLGAPDTGLISYAEMLDTGRCANEATHSLPIIGDGDTGYGNAMNVKRTVKGYAQAGFAGILIEDQVAPKSCGHVRGKRVVGREEAVARIRAAVDAREEGADILIVARTDARQAVSLEEALWRAQAFAAAGADVLFIDALESEEEMRTFCMLGGAAAGVPKMANMLEGGGKTPILPPAALQAMGFKLVAYPLSLLGVSIRAMQSALQGLREGRLPPSDSLGSFADIQAAVGFPEYYDEERRYAVSAPSTSFPPADAYRAPPSTPPPPPPPPPTSSTSSSSASSAASGASAAGFSGFGSSAAWSQQVQAAQQAARSSNPAPPPPPVVEPEVIAPDARTGRSSPASWPMPDEPRTSSSSSTTYEPPSTMPAPTSRPAPDSSSGSSSSSGPDPAYRRNRTMRVRIADRNTGLVKLETRIPAGFLNGLQALVPQVAGFNVEAALEQAMGPGGVLPGPGQPIVNINSGVDNIQIFLE